MADARPRSLLDPAAIAHGEALGLLARSIVDGYRAGDHRSSARSYAIEFAHHREYTPGDDMRHIDWKLHGRTDRYYIKQYEQDTNLVVHLLVDGSGSMDYGSGPLTKLDYAKSLAACLAYLVLLQRDAVSLSVFDTETRQHLPRTDNLGKIHLIMDHFAAFKATQQTSLGAAMNHLAGTVRTRGIVILLSDLFDDEAVFERGLRQLRAEGHEVVVFHILDAAELTFPFAGRVEFLGIEEHATVETSPADIRETYLAAIEAQCGRLRLACESAGSHYIRANTGNTLAETLGGYLAFRHQLRRR